MRLHDSSFLTRDGEPLTGRKPPVVNVMVGRLNRRQEDELRHLYREFCDRKMLSLAQHHAVERTMTDGSRVRIQSIQDADQVLVWPAGQLLPSTPWFAGYPVYVGLDFMPVYDRVVIDESSSDKPPYPEEPKFTKPPPVQKYPPSVRGKFEYVEGGVLSTVYLTDGQVLFSQIGTGGEYEQPDGTYVTWDNFPYFTFVPDDFSMNGVGEYGTPDGVRLTSFNAGALLISVTHRKFNPPIDYVTGGDVFYPDGQLRYKGVTGNTGMYTAAAQANEVRKALEQQYKQEYQAALIEYQNEYETWLATDYQRWIDACKAIDDAYPPLGPYPVEPLRRSGRDSQAKAIRERLLAGVTDPHLARRFLIFPWNIGFQPRANLQTSGTVTAQGPEWDGQISRRIKFTLTGADRGTVVPDPVGTDPIDEAQFGHDPAHPLRRDMAASRWLFGWRGDGTYERYAAYRPFHQQELPEIRGLAQVQFSKRGDYDQFIRSGLERSSRTDLVIESDGFVPEGARLTMVFFEWEVWDKYLGDWIWTPHPSLPVVDAVWIKSQGRYAFPLPYELPAGAYSPRAVRIWGATEQKRNGDSSWSSPRSIQFAAWEETVASMLTSFPVGVAIVEGLSATAAPIPNGSSAFPFGARALWSGDRDRLGAVLNQAWDKSASNDQVIAVGLRAVKKA